MSGLLNSTGAVSGILGSSVLPTGVTGGKGLDATPLNGRNMIINGDMQVWQRATGTTTVSNGTYPTADRYKFWTSSDGTWTCEKHAMSLAEINTTGHANAFGMSVTGADTSLSSSQHAYFAQRVEAQNCQHLQWGTAAAKDLTVSFWVKSNLTGTYCFGIVKQDTTLYYINREYTINVADTWEYKTITITPTAGGTSLITGAGGIIVNDNGHGLNLTWSLAFGTTYQATTNTWATGAAFASSSQVNWLNSTSNNFYITGIQVEAGSVATPYEKRSYADELIRCERYCKVYQGAEGLTSMVGAAGSGTTTNSYGNFHLAVVPRATPSLSITGECRSSDNFTVDVAASPPGVGTNIVAGDLQNGRFYLQSWATLIGGRSYYCGDGSGSGSGKMIFSMEL